MESFSLITVTLASILTSFSSNNGVIEEAVIKTHISPEISGLWELDLQAKPDFAEQLTLNNTNEKGEINPDINELITAIKESNKLEELRTVKPVDAEKSNQQAVTAASNSSCRERYNFGADNKVLTTSGEEWTYGQYVYQHQAEGLPVIAISTTYDNNKADCSGQQVDQTGDAMIAFVDYRPEKNTMRWCIDKDGKNCFMTFNKLLP